MFHLFRKSRVKTPTVFQMEEAECGAACLGMVLEYYGYYEPLEKLREACGVSRDGSIALLMIKAAALYNLSGKGYKLEVGQLSAKPCPMILFWGFDHYVVYEGRRGDNFYINDPARGPRVVPLEDFERQYTGVALCFEKTADFRKHGRKKGILAAIFPLVREMKGVYLALLWLGVLSIIPGLVAPAIMQVFVDHVMVDKQSWIRPLLLLYGATVIIQVLIVLIQSSIFRKTELRLTVNSSLTILERILKLPLEFFFSRSTGDIQNRVELNKSVTSAAFGQLGTMMIKVFTACFFLILMFFYSPSLTGIVVLTAVLNFVVLTYARRTLQVINQNFVVISTKMINFTMSTFDLIESHKAAGREDQVFAQWGGLVADYSDKRSRMQRYAIFFSLLPALLFGFNSVFVLCLGAWQVIDGEMTLGGMFAFQVLATGFIQPVSALVDSSVQIQMLKGNLDRVNDVMQYRESTRFADAGTDADVCSEREGMKDGPLFEMRDVSYGYVRMREPLIEGFNLKLFAGSRVAVVGASGSGKSTVAKLAAGLLTPWSGSILYENKPIECMRSRDFYDSVASVDQSIMLFSGTVEENLSLFKKYNDHAVLNKALRDAAIDQELIKRGSPLDVEVGEMGNNFSGGQQQRLEIARVLSLDTPIVILDEATSCLDPLTEQKIDHALRKRGATCLIVAHRLSTVRDCDEIIVMDHGRIVERGRHDDLMALRGCYYHLIKGEGGIV